MNVGIFLLCGRRDFTLNEKSFALDAKGGFYILNVKKAVIIHPWLGVMGDCFRYSEFTPLVGCERAAITYTPLDGYDVVAFIYTPLVGCDVVAFIYYTPLVGCDVVVFIYTPLVGCDGAGRRNNEPLPQLPAYNCNPQVSIKLPRCLFPWERGEGREGGGQRHSSRPH